MAVQSVVIWYLLMQALSPTDSATKGAYKVASRSYEQIQYEMRGAVGVVRLNRPEKLNAWTGQMDDELRECIATCNQDDSIRAIVIGANGRAFCAGADMGVFDDRSRQQAETPGPSELRHPLPGILMNAKPTIAAMQGYAVGVGLTFALSADIRLAADDLQASLRFVRVGLVPEFGSTALLPKMVGIANALDMAISGRSVSADDAFRMGLVRAIHPRETLMDEAIALGQEVASLPTEAVRMAKQLIYLNASESDVEAAMEHEEIRDRYVRNLPAHHDAVKAFLASRGAPGGHRPQ